MVVFANILQPLIDIFEPVLKFFHDTVGLGWGMSIIALTVAVRALMVPLTLNQIRSMRKLQQYAPYLKEIQAKYKGDRERMSQETMRFYKENSINPLASCMPLVLQLPVFLALFYMLQSDLRHEICGDSTRPCGDVPVGEAVAKVPEFKESDIEFLFIPDITDKATGAVLIVLIVLYVGSQLTSTLVTAATMDKNQRMIFLALPFLFVVFAINFPAGLLVYWITTNLWTLGQQLIVRKVMPAPKPGELVPLKGGKNGGGASLEKKGGKSSDDDGKNGGGKKKAAAANPGAKSTGKPPPPPRKRKKRSGRRR